MKDRWLAQRSVTKLTSLGTELQSLSSAGLHDSFLHSKASVSKSFSVVVSSSSAGRTLGRHCATLSSSRIPCVGFFSSIQGDVRIDSNPELYSIWKALFRNQEKTIKKTCSLAGSGHCIFTSIHVFHMTPFLEMSNMDVQGFEEIWAASVFSQIISE